MEKLGSRIVTPVEQAQLTSLASDILQQAKRNGASQAEVCASISSGLSIQTRMCEVDKILFNRDRNFAITVYFGKRKGLASSSDLSLAALTKTLHSACEIAKASAEDAYVGLADPDRLAFNYPDLDLNHPWELSPQQAIEMAKNCEEIALSQDKKITNSEGVSLSSDQGFDIYANSHGFLGSQLSTCHQVSCVLIAQEKGRMERGYDYSIARDHTKLMPLEDVASRAANRTLAKLGARRLATQRSPVVFAAEVARSLFASLISAISGRNLYMKSSFLLDYLGKQIFPSFVQIKENPLILGGLGSAAFDGEGVKTIAKDIVKDGKLNSYILNSYAARRLGLQTTANAGGTHNILVATQPLSFKALLKQMGTGLLVTDLIGDGINILTGDYSRGASGFWVEKGEVQYPVEEITIAGNLRDMFAGIQGIANDVDVRSNIQTGSILIDEVVVGGQ